MNNIDTIFLKYNRRLQYFARKFLPAQDAEEVVADVFVLLWRATPVFKTDSDTRGWLYRVTRNECLDRRETLKVTYELQPWHDKAEVMAETLGELYEEIERLPARCREIFKGIYLEDQSYEQMAVRTGTSIKNIRTQVYLAIKKLRIKFHVRDGIISASINTQYQRAQSLAAAGLKCKDIAAELNTSVNYVHRSIRKKYKTR